MLQAGQEVETVIVYSEASLGISDITQQTACSLGSDVTCW